jgi:DNA mismatch repair protein PMS2
LTAADEITVMENLDIFASNGFGLIVDEDAPYGQGEKIRLIAMPVSKETTFDEKGQESHSTIFAIED